MFNHATDVTRDAVGVPLTLAQLGRIEPEDESPTLDLIAIRPDVPIFGRIS
jgi:hypothetical protein